ncbi:interleukin-1 receptor-associated kinase 1 isoform X1 [Siniperca chuatsi]|uniref:interleukin-1 receptor-associated kinase 1 isoform X1 n=2 Tax=Siniperca chuatsi TaxID=119488 RepID=UPI001CE09569|nr:interleukin-1 receptor-associated kinase 1 isoform X1 [Siniperca chuatsi]XP_044066654.1 interleukin-1 receptor-associated kinase 1 isoform X1 [Siniperca chuatsi]
MSAGDPRGRFLYELPPSVLWEFCLLMDGLSDLDWTRFASEVLKDQTAVRLAERRERRTDWVMNRWENRNGRVWELIDLLERLQLLRPRDVILGWASSLKLSVSPPPPPPPPPPVSLSQFDPPPKQSEAPPTLSTCKLSTTVDQGGGRPLPRPAPPPSSLQSDLHQPPQPPLVVACSSSSRVMCWSYEEVHAGTKGFSPSLQVGEGGFGVVYRASLRNTDCAVKRFKQDCLLDWTLLEESFHTEVDKLTKFRHPNIVDLLGFSEGQGSVCLIYSYMENRSLEDQLQKEGVSLSWSQRVGVLEGAATALQFLHFPPDGHKRLIHGDIKSSNILLDRHLVAKLADFGLARFASRSSSGRSAAQTASVGKTAMVRGTLAYLPDEYVRNGELGTAVDVYSFGVVLLEVLTGRRALEKDRKSGERYLKDLVEEVEDSPSSAASWRKQLDHRLIPGGAAEPAGCMEMVALACKCLDKNRKKRPAMTEVFDKLQDIHKIVRKTGASSSPLHHPYLQPPSQSFPRPPPSLDSSVGALSTQLSKLGPLEDTYQPPQSSQLSSSSFCSLTPPHPLHSSSLPPPSSSFAGPCETDESRGFSQYDLRSQFRSNGTSSRSLSPSTRDQYHIPAGPGESQFSQPSVPTEDQYNFLPQASSTSDGSGDLTGAPTGPDTREQTTAAATAGLYGVPECLSPMESLHSSSPGPSVHVNLSKQRFLQKKTLYEEGRIHTAELLSSDDLYGGRSSVELRGPEESDELDYLPAEHD